MIHLGTVFKVVIELVAGGVIAYLLLYAIGLIPVEPIKVVGKILVILFVVVWLIGIVVSLNSGQSLFTYP